MAALPPLNAQIAVLESDDMLAEVLSFAGIKKCGERARVSQTWLKALRLAANQMTSFHNEDIKQLGRMPDLENRSKKLFNVNNPHLISCRLVLCLR